MGLLVEDHYFDLIVHLGSVTAMLLFFRKEVVTVFSNKKIFFFFFLALIPLIPAYLLLKKIKISLTLGIFLTSLLLFISYKASETKVRTQHKIKDVLFIGMMQGIALLPGVSRAGSTISAACMRGWKMQDAIRFSFMLAIPTVLGGSLVETYKIKASLPSSMLVYVVGFVTSFAIGTVVIGCLMKMKKIHLLYFSIYMLLLGLVLLCQ